MTRYLVGIAQLLWCVPLPGGTPAVSAEAVGESEPSPVVWFATGDGKRSVSCGTVVLPGADDGDRIIAQAVAERQRYRIHTANRPCDFWVHRIRVTGAPGRPVFVVFSPERGPRELLMVKVMASALQLLSVLALHDEQGVVSVFPMVACEDEDRAVGLYAAALAGSIAQEEDVDDEAGAGGIAQAALPYGLERPLAELDARELILSKAGLSPELLRMARAAGRGGRLRPSVEAYWQVPRARFVHLRLYLEKDITIHLLAAQMTGSQVWDFRDQWVSLAMGSGEAWECIRERRGGRRKVDWGNGD